MTQKQPTQCHREVPEWCFAATRIYRLEAEVKRLGNKLERTEMELRETAERWERVSVTDKMNVEDEIASVCGMKHCRSRPLPP